MANGLLDYFLENLPELWEGLQVTLYLTALGLVIGFVIGVALAVGRTYGNVFVKPFSIGYIELFRGTPLLVQLFLLYFGVNSLGFVSITPIQAAILGFTLNSAAYQAEYIRGAIQSIESGQMIAGRALGMTQLQSIRNIILPQALRISIPAWSNEIIYLLKYTSVAYLITVQELTAKGKIITSVDYRYLEMFTLIGIIYLSLTIVITEFVDRFEEKVRIPGLGVQKGGRRAL